MTAAAVDLCTYLIRVLATNVGLTRVCNVGYNVVREVLFPNNVPFSVGMLDSVWQVLGC